ncbi:T9SS type A sorting domain-containing protein [Candidatus Eisenbacteria bacterium]|uniref:T9SS type A sorting domain-containing protein n=1 Tax=Eiseniibacteriota bacterium TaxID=2212470 RepID=A0ABV6YQK8_UNCEI
MTIQKFGSTWYSTEVTLEEALGYGDYIFTTVGEVDQFHQNTVLGLFIWQYGPCWGEQYLWWNPYNEIDVEFSRWGDPGNDPAQFMVQPWDWPGSGSRFELTPGPGELSSHAFNWLHDRLEFRSWYGGPDDEAPENMIHSWTYTGPHIPRPEQPRVHINLWQLNGGPGIYQEAVLDEFTFVPEGTAGIDEDTEEVPIAGGSRISLARPNPFGPQTTITYSLKRGGMVDISVFDVRGRRLRTLVEGYAHAGDHDIVWDGTDDSGAWAAPGVYLYRLRTGDIVETRRIVKLK